MNRNIILIILLIINVNSILGNYVDGMSYNDFAALDKSNENDDGSIDIKAGGSSFAAKVIYDAIFGFQFVETQANLAYHSIGSRQTTCRLKSYKDYCETPWHQTEPGDDTKLPITLDFGESDTILVDQDYIDAPDIQLYPMMAGAIVPIYNIPGMANTLRLTPNLVARIFRGCHNDTRADCEPNSITNWNHAEILAINEPEDHAAIIAAGEIEVVVRSDENGVTEIFKKSLGHFDSAFETQIQDLDASCIWRGTDHSSKRLFDEGVAGHVMRTIGSVGYTVLSEAGHLDVPFADMVHDVNDVEGTTVSATSHSVELAVFEKGFEFG
jgi:ABC-type phosphate transport system substrate-binding protein